MTALGLDLLSGAREFWSAPAENVFISPRSSLADTDSEITAICSDSNSGKKEVRVYPLSLGTFYDPIIFPLEEEKSDISQCSVAFSWWGTYLLLWDHIYDTSSKTTLLADTGTKRERTRLGERGMRAVHDVLLRAGKPESPARFTRIGHVFFPAAG